ncbi:hypothetical protein PR202_gb20823 [Eleusine coracana subsp. coracana]|uniref:Uncharacterized protein n=1 Tax=Eleusine coracana subsp. coracana TaxID=191504 RepID=A0AAV5F9J4_ELECO|nr:hypothetical protein PR202_gb20823 [Eleusine coracana subsp. coracana]
MQEPALSLAREERKRISFLPGQARVVLASSGLAPENRARLNRENQSHPIYDLDAGSHHASELQAPLHMYWAGLYPEDVQDVIKAGANAMLQAALEVMNRQGRCIMLPAAAAMEDEVEEGNPDE